MPCHAALTLALQPRRWANNRVATRYESVVLHPTILIGMMIGAFGAESNNKGDE